MLRSLVFILAFHPLTSSGCAPAQADSSPILRDLVASGALTDMRRPDFSDYRSRVESFYQPAGYALAWTWGGVITDPAKAIIERLKQADAKGLDAEDYDGSRWTDRLARLRYGAPPASASDLARFDLALTVSLMRYASDVHLGRANPGLFHATFDLASDQDDLPGFIRRRLAGSTDVSVVLDGIDRYWAFVSPGVKLIRLVSLATLKVESERRARQAHFNNIVNLCPDAWQPLASSSPRGIYMLIGHVSGETPKSEACIWRASNIGWNTVKR